MAPVPDESDRVEPDMVPDAVIVPVPEVWMVTKPVVELAVTAPPKLIAEPLVERIVKSSLVASRAPVVVMVPLATILSAPVLAVNPVEVIAALLVKLALPAVPETARAPVLETATEPLVEDVKVGVCVSTAKGATLRVKLPEVEVNEMLPAAPVE